MWKKIIIYVIILIILLGLYFLFAPQVAKSPAEIRSVQKEFFQGPTGPPLIKGPSGPPPQQ